MSQQFIHRGKREGHSKRLTLYLRKASVTQRLLQFCRVGQREGVGAAPGWRWLPHPAAEHRKRQGNHGHALRRPPDGGGEPPAWNEAVSEAGQRAHGIVEEQNPPAADHRVEGIGRQRHGLRVPFHKLDIPDSGLLHALTRHSQHLRGLVNRHHRAVRANQPRRSHRWFADTRRHVEHPLARRNARQRHHPIAEWLRATLEGCPMRAPALRNIAPLRALLGLEGRWVHVSVSHRVLSFPDTPGDVHLRQHRASLTNKKARFPSESSLYLCGSTPTSSTEHRAPACGGVTAIPQPGAPSVRTHWGRAYECPTHLERLNCYFN